MITTRHSKYLQKYPERIARERRERKVTAAMHQADQGMSVKTMRKTLSEYMKSRPSSAPIRAGKQTFMGRIKNFFRKPTV